MTHPDLPALQPESVRRIELNVDVSSAATALGQAAKVSVEIILPLHHQPHLLFVCLPGGGMNRRYFDLPTPEREAEASFAAAMAKRGFAIALIDPLGVGGSTLPDDPYLLTPDMIAAATAIATRSLLTRLREGDMTVDISAMPGLKSVGIGHSFGAGLTVVQQAIEPVHDGLVLLGFGLNGMPEQLNRDDRGMPAAEARARFTELARRYNPEPVRWREAPVSPRGISAKVAADRLLPVAAMTAILPDLLKQDAARIDVPMLMAFGDRDLHGSPHDAPSSFTGSSDITLVVLRDTRHNHFTYPSRTALFDRIATWAATL